MLKIFVKGVVEDQTWDKEGGLIDK